MKAEEFMRWYANYKLTKEYKESPHTTIFVDFVTKEIVSWVELTDEHFEEAS